MLAQRREIDVKHIQAEVKVLPQLAGADGLLRFFVGCRENAYVNRCLTLAPQSAHFAIFQNAQ